MRVELRDADEIDEEYVERLGITPFATIRDGEISLSNQARELVNHAWCDAVRRADVHPEAVTSDEHRAWCDAVESILESWARERWTVEELRAAWRRSR